MNELLPCPFCGALPKMENGHLGWSIGCPDAFVPYGEHDAPCQMRPVIVMQTRENAIKKWNTRTRVSPATDWQPIETAPINQSVLIFIPHIEHYGAGIYRGLLPDFGTRRDWQVSGLHMGRDCGPGYRPTHWMPLPPAPSAAIQPNESEVGR